MYKKLSFEKQMHVEGIIDLIKKFSMTKRLGIMNQIKNSRLQLGKQQPIERILKKGK